MSRFFSPPTPRPFAAQSFYTSAPRPFAHETRFQPETPFTDLSRLRSYQRDDVPHLVERRFVLLGYEMRVGKTAVALSALPLHGRTIVVCPATIKLQWRDAVRGVRGDAEYEGGKWQTVGWRKDLTPRIVESGDSIVPRDGEVVIANYEALPEPVKRNRLVEENLSDVRLIIDEAHFVKNEHADRTAKVRALVRQVHSAWPLTGTPMPGSPLDLWGLLEACNLHKQAFGEKNTFKNFLEMFGGRKSSRKFGPEYEFDVTDYGPGRAALARVMLRKTLHEVAPDMAGKHYIEIPVELTESALVERAEAEWQLLGAESLPPFEMLSQAMAELARAKIPAMLAVVEEHEIAERPLLVFAAHLDPLRELENRPGWMTITGEGDIKERHAIVEAFQRGQLRGLGISIKAGGTGLALHRAEDELFVSLSYTPSDNIQAEDRAISLEQREKVLNINLLVADHPLDRRLFEILGAKTELVEGVVG